MNIRRNSFIENHRQRSYYQKWNCDAKLVRSYT